MSANSHRFKTGLLPHEVLAARKQYGLNEVKETGNWTWLHFVKELVLEPMFILLLLAAIIYLISGETSEALFMFGAILLVSAISVYQGARSQRALQALKKLSEPLATVIRGGKTIEIATWELVIGDTLLLEEGHFIAADGTVVEANDFNVNESILTGESFTVYKEPLKGSNEVYQGCFVTGGQAIVVVTAIGQQTKLGQIGKSIDNIKTSASPLQEQVNSFVKKMALAGVVIFLLVWGMHYLKSHLLLDSLLKALTLAMSILPEEIPIAFTTFMALGAWRLAELGIIVKQPVTVEALGSASVICTDKTGTITENNMKVAGLYTAGSEEPVEDLQKLDENALQLLRAAAFASEIVPFDPMEKSIHELFSRQLKTDERIGAKLIKEYPLAGKPPMMTHIFQLADQRLIIAAKGALEAILSVCKKSSYNQLVIDRVVNEFSAKGFRVLGVAEGFQPEDATAYPERQEEFEFNFIGLIAFYDPPKKNMGDILNRFYEAGIAVKIITGDNGKTTSAIGKEIGFRGYDTVIDGETFVQLDEPAKQKAIQQHAVFARMFPEAKLVVIQLLKKSGQVVAMTGDGVNDGPALKAAHIGIAMGSKGSELAKNAASLILTDDDLGKMADAVARGRTIYSNLKKAIQYIISIHIPIIFTIFLPLALGWVYPDLFTPVHVIFLELIMGPTCSIVYENEPIERGIMKAPPRPMKDTFFSWKELSISIVQGMVITLCTLLIYQYAVFLHFTEAATRTMVFISLIAANISLTLVNRSFRYTLLTTLRYKNKLVPRLLLLTIGLMLLIFSIKSFRTFFGFELLPVHIYIISIVAGILSTIWIEPVKFFIFRQEQKRADRS